MKDGIMPPYDLTADDGVITVDPEIEARWITCIEFANANLAKRRKLLRFLEDQLLITRNEEVRAQLKVAIEDMRRAIRGSYRFRHEYAEKLGIGARYPLPH